MFVAVLRMSESFKFAAETVTSIKTLIMTIDRIPIATTTSISVKPRAAFAGLRRLLLHPCLAYVLDQLLVIRTSSCPPSGEPTRTLLSRHYIAKGGRIARIGVDKRSSGRWPVSKGIVKDVRGARTIKQ